MIAIQNSRWVPTKLNVQFDLPVGALLQQETYSDCNIKQPGTSRAPKRSCRHPRGLHWRTGRRYVCHRHSRETRCRVPRPN
jgi:hypothetical protein